LGIDRNAAKVLIPATFVVLLNRGGDVFVAAIDLVKSADTLFDGVRFLAPVIADGAEAVDASPLYVVEHGLLLNRGLERASGEGWGVSAIK
jgi:hypothetical protein